MVQAMIRYGNGNSGIGFLSSYRKIDELPFDFASFRLSICVQNLFKNHQIVCSDTSEEMLLVCSYIGIKEKIIPLTEESRNNVVELVSSHNEQGFRVLILATLELSVDEVKLQPSVADKREAELQGLLTFLYSPRESIAMAIVVLRRNII
ncbi:hypothetical protein [Xenorhabdus sp. PB62.4]|uniref:hypothetical protein n=1 Tax=Xenorhabdus sp. PB62.4 TaxID=1851573 RepID=UPI0016569F3A|nr:hypothetical protein [Xenorhabdus sp. PB62.4]MBC8954714.1 hypothetical protein [Xenorhabdus sp. PB62.4]